MFVCLIKNTRVTRVTADRPKTVFSHLKFRTLRAQLGKNTQNYSHTGRKQVGDPIFLLQFLNVLYMADFCAKFEKNLYGTSFSRELL